VLTKRSWRVQNLHRDRAVLYQHRNHPRLLQRANVVLCFNLLDNLHPAVSTD